MRESLRKIKTYGDIIYSKYEWLSAKEWEFPILESEFCDKSKAMSAVKKLY